MKADRQIIFHGQYFKEFYIHQTQRVQEKIGYVFRIIKTVEKIPEKFLKHIKGTDGLYEIRVESGGNIFRIFCCFDRMNLVILFNAFQKKSQKTSIKEVELAEKLRKDYFNLKNSKK